MSYSSARLCVHQEMLVGFRSSSCHCLKLSLARMKPAFPSWAAEQLPEPLWGQLKVLFLGLPILLQHTKLLPHQLSKMQSLWPFCFRRHPSKTSPEGLLLLLEFSLTAGVRQWVLRLLLQQAPVTIKAHLLAAATATEASTWPTRTFHVHNYPGDVQEISIKLKTRWRGAFTRCSQITLTIPIWVYQVCLAISPISWCNLPSGSDQIGSSFYPSV